MNKTNNTIPKEMTVVMPTTDTDSDIMYYLEYILSICHEKGKAEGEERRFSGH